MKTLRLQKTVPARELPPSWREEGAVAPDERVTVTIEREDVELARAGSLVDVMEIIGCRAEARGLTEEKLDIGARPEERGPAEEMHAWFLARLDAPPQPNERLRRTMQTRAPWETEST